MKTNESICWLSSMGMTLTVGGLMLVGGMARGEQLEFENPQSQLITSPTEISRALVNPGSLATLENRLVTSARLVLPGPTEVLDRDLDVIVAPIGRSWINGAATWTSPWETPGGDALMDYAQLTQVPKGVNLEKVSLDVSLAVRAMAFGEIENHGFLVMVAPYQGGGFDDPEVSKFGSFSGAELAVQYRQQNAVDAVNEQ